jgi:hypothetical protein
MKTWAWIVGGVGVAAGAWWYLKGRNSATTEMSYPEGVVPGVTPGYPAAPSVDELPPDTAQQMAPAMGENYAAPAQSSSSQASAVSTGYSEPSTNTPSSSGAPYAVDTGTGTTTPSPKAPLFSIAPSSPLVDTTSYVRPVRPSPKPSVALMLAPRPTVAPRPMVAPQAMPTVSLPKTVIPSQPTVSLPSPVVAPRPIVSSPRPVVAPQPTKVMVTTYRSPVTSATRTVVVPVVAAPKPVVVAPMVKSPTPTIVTKPLTRPLAVARPTNLRGVYAVGADFTEAEYRAMGVRAELETRRREWAANQMAENAAINARR